MIKKCSRLLLLLLAVAMIFTVGCNKDVNDGSPTDAIQMASKDEAQMTPTEKQAPWNNGGKQPDEYTYEEFLALEPGEQIAFQKSFANMTEFDKWLQKSQQTNTETVALPWEKEGAKQPVEYTFEEFQNLAPSHQIAFQKSFATMDEFDQWLQKAQQVEIELPWAKEGAKQPKDYTLKEFERLTPGQQIAFQKEFESPEAFKAWMDSAK